MAVLNQITEQEYAELALGDGDRVLELWDGVPREKPGMSYEHNDAAFELGVALRLQLDPAAFRIRVNSSRLRRTARNHFVPDVAVIPIDLARTQQGRPGTLETYADPLPLVVEVWSPSTGAYDLSTKLAAYQARGDREIWYLHPYERTLTAWRRQPDGSYAETAYSGGVVPVLSLPGVAIDLDALFAE